MAEIPEPTKDDWGWMEFYLGQFSNPDIPFDRICHPESRMWFRLLHHYRQRCEELERERDDAVTEMQQTLTALINTRNLAADKAAEWKSRIADLEKMLQEKGGAA